MLDRGKTTDTALQITEKHGSKPSVGPKPTLDTSSLPEIFITKILGAHRCQCADCDADFKTRVESEMTRKLTKELRIELSENTRARLEREITNKFDNETKPGLIKQLEEATTAEFRASLKQELKQELLSSLGSV